MRFRIPDDGDVDAITELAALFGAVAALVEDKVHYGTSEQIIVQLETLYGRAINAVVLSGAGPDAARGMAA